MSLDLYSPRGIKKYLKNAKDMDDWKKRCDKIERLNGGICPNFFYREIILSGFMNEVTKDFICR